MHFTRTLTRAFPVPHMLVPHGAGVDITDSSVKWLDLTRVGTHMRVHSYGNQNISAGIVTSGAVRDPKALGDTLRAIKKETKIAHAHVALPEEGAYVFTMHVPHQSTRPQIMNIVEFELENRVPIPPHQAVYDFDQIPGRDEHGQEIAVTVFSKDLAEGYVQAFSHAGIELMSLEIEARSIARAIVRDDDPITLIADCGRARTGVAIIKKGIPIFTSTIDIGGDDIGKVISSTLSITDENEVQKFKNEHGLVVDDPAHANTAEAIQKVTALLADQISRHHRFFETRRDEGGAHVSVDAVYLLGGTANLRGISEFISGKVQVPAEQPNVWTNVCAFDEYIPPIPQRASLQYATAIGLALRGV